MPEPDQNITNHIYTPASIISVFNNVISVNAEKKLITISGIYKKIGTKSYKGYYYDQLSDDGGGYSLKVITSELKREKIEENKLVTFMGFITRRINKDGNISILINLDNLIEQEESNFTEEDLKKQELLKKKFDLGFKDVNSLIKRKIFENKKINIGLITGESGQIDNDIKNSVGAADNYFILNFDKTNLSSSESVILKLQNFNSNENIDFIVVARGGGSGLEHFENINLCYASLSLDKPVVSAIGHQPDKTLFERISDKSFITPTAFGNYLKDITEQYANELKNSTAKIISDTTQLVNKQFSERIKNFEISKKEQDALLKNYKDSIVLLNEEMNKLKRSKIVTITIGIIMGLIAGYLISLLF